MPFLPIITGTPTNKSLTHIHHSNKLSMVDFLIYHQIPAFLPTAGEKAELFFIKATISPPPFLVLLTI